MSNQEGSEGETLPLKNPMAEGQKVKPRVRTTAQLLSDVKAFADKTVRDKSIPETEWGIHIRTYSEAVGLRLQANELTQIRETAKQQRDGRFTVLRRTDPVDRTPTPWLWEGVIMRRAVNLVFGAPKTGKTKLCLSFLSAYLHGGGTYLNRKMKSGDEELFIVGPDQAPGRWVDMLEEASLLDEEGLWHPRIRGVIGAGHRFCLNEDGIKFLEDEARESPGLIVLLDCYSRAIAGTGLDENRPEACTPLVQLAEALAHYGATLIVIHHSNKGGGDGSISGGARGSSAITAAVDQLVSLKPFGQSNFDDGKEVELKTEGRGGRPVSMVLKLEDDGKTWANTGTVSKRKRDAEDQKLAEELSDNQRAFTLALVAAWEEDKTALTKKEVGERMGYKDGSVLNRMGGWVAPLIDKKGMVEKAGTRTSSSGRPEVLYRPTDKALKYVTKEPPF